MTSEKAELMRECRQLGFAQYTPRTSTWKTVLVNRNDARQTLFILFSFVGIDFKVYLDDVELRFDEHSRLYTHGGELKRFRYDQFASQADLHDFVRDIVRKFMLSESVPLDDAFDPKERKKPHWCELCLFDLDGTLLRTADLAAFRGRQHVEQPGDIPGYTMSDAYHEELVKTLRARAHGAVIASRVATHFAEQGWSIVSGLALGCDAIAHQASIDAGGHTMAVMAHGLQTVTPAQHRRLAEHILSSGGALVSEFPFGQEPLPQLFARRDRTQAGQAQGVIMIQSGLDGGSLHACRAAQAYERWLALPYPTERDLQDGSEKIHANVMLTEGTTEERTSLLSCKADALDRVVILRDKRDYDRLHHYEAPSTRDLLT